MGCGAQVIAYMGHASIDALIDIAAFSFCGGVSQCDRLRFSAAAAVCGVSECGGEPWFRYRLRWGVR